MKNKTSAFLLFSTILLSCLVAALTNSAPTSQSDALRRFSKTKLRNIDNHMNNKLFDASELIFDDSQLVDRSQPDQKNYDKIVSLPGQPLVTFSQYISQYSGYVNVNTKAGRSLFYYFVEAQRSSNTSPLILWLNGGPGCSSLGYGAMEEIGPFRVNSDGKTLYTNDYAWNQVANVLFLETPAGVGFSYSNTTDDVNSGGDKQTASENLVFLLNWFERFTEYKNRKFYIAGESYAGHYVPELAQLIINYNKKVGGNSINLRGIIIGNAAINDETDNKGMWENFASHALITDDGANEVLKECDFRNFFPPWINKSAKCNTSMEKVYYANLQNINIYSIYAPLCSDDNPTDKPKKTSLFKFDPCSEYYVYAYLNRPDVQKALHANVTKIPYDWVHCSWSLDNWTDSPYTVIPLLKEIMANNIPVWIYSGDVDGRIPVTSTQQSIKMMNLPIQTSWCPWYHLEELGGYTQAYKGNLIFATVRGAGHEVPSYQPQRALSLINHFLDGERLPCSSKN